MRCMVNIIVLAYYEFDPPEPFLLANRAAIFAKLLGLGLLAGSLSLAAGRDCLAGGFFSRVGALCVSPGAMGNRSTAACTGLGSTDRLGAE